MTWNGMGMELEWEWEWERGMEGNGMTWNGLNERHEMHECNGESMDERMNE